MTALLTGITDSTLNKGLRLPYRIDPPVPGVNRQMNPLPPEFTPFQGAIFFTCKDSGNAFENGTEFIREFNPLQEDQAIQFSSVCAHFELQEGTGFVPCQHLVSGVSIGSVMMMNPRKFLENNRLNEDRILQQDYIWMRRDTFEYQGQRYYYFVPTPKKPNQRERYLDWFIGQAMENAEPGMPFRVALTVHPVLSGEEITTQ